MDFADQFRNLLSAADLVQAPGAYDPLTARLIEAAGFPAVYMSGYATAASYGVSDTGIIGFDEMLSNARRIANAVAIPLFADADTGYDDPAETTRLYEEAGVAAIQIEDQAWPKKCGHMEGKVLVTPEEMCARIEMSAAARRDNGIAIVARTDAIAVEGFESAIDRAARYAEAGADVLFVEAPVDRGQIEEIPRRLPQLPHVYNAAPRTPAVSAADLRRLGYKLAIYPGVTFAATMLGAEAALSELKETGEQANLQEWKRRFDNWNAFLGERT